MLAHFCSGIFWLHQIRGLGDLANHWPWDQEANLIKRLGANLQSCITAFLLLQNDQTCEKVLSNFLLYLSVIIIISLFFYFYRAVHWGTAIQGRLATEPMKALKTPFTFKFREQKFGEENHWDKYVWTRQGKFHQTNGLKLAIIKWYIVKRDLAQSSPKLII